MAIKHAVQLLRAGEAVCLFPEGQLSESGELQKVLPGAGLIAKMAGTPILCCGLRGTNRVLPYGSIIPRPSVTTIHLDWGQVHQFEKDIEIEVIVAWIEEELRSLTSE